MFTDLNTGGFLIESCFIHFIEDVKFFLINYKQIFIH